MQAVALAKDAALRRGHWPMRDDARSGGRAALLCVHCGARATHVNRELRGTLVEPTGKCFGFEPRSRRQVELAELDQYDGWPRSPIAEANWATRTAAAYRRHDEQRAKERGA